MDRVSKLILVMTVVVVTALSSLTIEASAPKILAVAAEDGEKYNLYTMDLNGKNPVKLYDLDYYFLEICWVSAADKRIYFHGDEGYCEMGLDGKDIDWFDFRGSDPQLSLDGKKVVYARPNFGFNVSSSIYMANSDGTGKTRITEAQEDVSDENPSWSPDGKQIVFTRNYKLWILDLQSMEEQEVDLSDYYISCSYPRWSLDGKKIAFIGSLFEGDIYLLHLETGEITAITDDGGFKESLLWTPDGKQLVYSHKSDYDEKADFYLIDPEGENKQKLTAGNWDYQQLEWFPE